MKKYLDTVLNQYGNPIPGVSCSVLMYPSNATATIFSDNGVTQTSNPVITDSEGRFEFYAANGRYNITFSGAGVDRESITDLLIDDPSEAYSYQIVGGSIDNTPIGNSVPSYGAFTTLVADNLVLAAYDGPIGQITPNIGTFSTLNATTLSVSGVATLVASSAVTAQNSSTLLGSTWVSPGAIGLTTPNTGSFTTLFSTGNTSLGPTSASSINNTIIGNITPADGTFTNIFVSNGINNTQIGNTTASTGRFTTLVATSGINSTTIGAVTPSSGVFTTVVGNTSVTSPIISSTSTLGYSVGAGGSVTQTTSKATTVLLNKATGKIITDPENLAAATAVSFTFTNSTIASTDNVVVNISSGGTAGAYAVSADQISAGSCRVSIRNLTGGALAETLHINFSVIKAVIT